MGSLVLTLDLKTTRMRILLATCLAVSVTAGPQGINFGGSSSSSGNKDITNRNNYGNGDNNKHYGNSNNGNTGNSNGNFQNGNGNSGSNHCCCIPEGNSCLEEYTNNGGDDLVGQGFIDERIVNRPNAGSNSNQPQTQTCPYRNKICCYPDSYDFSVFGRTCVAPSGSGSSSGFTQGGSQSSQSGAAWRQGCSETSVYGSNQCGTRNYRGPVDNLNYGEASPGEFPWTCLLLNQNNDFIGTCAVIPEGFNNDNNAGTSKVITAAHNLKKVGFNEIVKVRVGEYDASGVNPPEKQKHEEYQVIKITKHHQFDPKRLSNDIAILRVNQRINLNHPYVNTACLPSCDNQFEHQFSNGTGVRCWVAGWGKNEFDGSFQFIQHKVDVPIVDDYKCNAALKRALNRKSAGVGDRFQLHDSEVCAGTETGKDACTGDGGSPLVCQAQSGRWTVVGLVSWGIGCATDIPGVYTKLSYFKNWINAN